MCTKKNPEKNQRASNRSTNPTPPQKTTQSFWTFQICRRSKFLLLPKIVDGMLHASIGRQSCRANIGTPSSLHQLTHGFLQLHLNQKVVDPNSQQNPPKSVVTKNPPKTCFLRLQNVCVFFFWNVALQKFHTWGQDHNFHSKTDLTTPRIYNVHIWRLGDDLIQVAVFDEHGWHLPFLSQKKTSFLFGLELFDNLNQTWLCL